MSKPIRDLIDLINYAFQEGSCTCMRCVSGEDQEEYQRQHNFDIDGLTFRRQFAKSGKDDLLSKIKALLKHHYKDEEIDFEAPLEEEKISELISEREYKLFILLGNSNGLIKEVIDGDIVFANA